MVNVAPRLGCLIGGPALFAGRISLASGAGAGVGVGRSTARVFPRLAMSTGPPPSQTGGIFAQFAQRYNAALETQPVLTKMAMTAGIVGTGDVMTQMFIEKRRLSDLDWKRLARMSALGAFLIGPVLHHWYGYLYRIMPGSDMSTVIKRVALDQFTFAPVFTATFFTAIFTLEGRLDELPKHFEDNYIPALKVNWMMWIPAQVINFSFIPPQHAVLFANFVALFWNSYLSWSSHQ